MRPFLNCLIWACVFACLQIDVGRADFIDDASSNNLSSYVVSGSSIAWDSSNGGFYQLPSTSSEGTVALTRLASAGGLYNATADGPIKVVAWMDGLGASRAYLTWVDSPTNVGLNDGSLTTGYGAHVRVRNSDDAPTHLAFINNRNNFLGRVQNSNADPTQLRLATSLGDAVVDIDDMTNPYFRLEWTIERENGENQFFFQLFEGDSPEFTGGTEITNAAWTAAHASNFDTGYLGVAMNDNGSGTRLGFGLQRFEVTSLAPVPEPASTAIWSLLIFAGVMVRRRRRST